MSQTAPVPAPARDAPVIALPPRGLRVLLVAKGGRERTAAALRLERLGCSVQTAVDRAEALFRSVVQEFDVVVGDRRIPELEAAFVPLPRDARLSSLARALDRARPRAASR